MFASLFRRRVLAIAAAILWTPQITYAQNLLTNGDFEADDSNTAIQLTNQWGWYTATATGWSSYGLAGEFSYPTPSTFGAAGYAFLGGSLVQPFAVTAGTTYRLDLDYGWWNDNATTVGTAAFGFQTVDSGGNRAWIATASATDSDLAWGDVHHYSTTYTPDFSGQLAVALSDGSVTGQVDYDNVGVTATPEPATVTFLASALLGLGVIYLRRRGAKA
jgi:hypothetical protein